MTFSASANPIVYLGLPCFIDSETTTWNLCPIALENAIQDRIRLGKNQKQLLLCICMVFLSSGSHSSHF